MEGYRPFYSDKQKQYWEIGQFIDLIFLSQSRRFEVGFPLFQGYNKNKNNQQQDRNMGSQTCALLT